MFAATGDYAEQRARMVHAIEQDIRGTRVYTGLERFDPAVMTAMGTVPRHEFVPANMREYAYWNRPLPIGHEQTISQPFIVALMTELARVNSVSTVLEVGTGSGYQAAVLAEVVQQVYSIEIIENLGVRARETLQRLGYSNVEVRIGDGYHGWSEAAPFDAILVTAAPEQIPQPLIDQLAPGGRLVIPVGAQGSIQSLKVLVKDAEGNIRESDALPVSFVPLTGDAN
ncbi:MAG: protein-L-isoaspartate(D-aspartate) O-methyltransferase [Thiotrichales bacterium]|nr:protein-L-isoaspartate(D-aspartate) O-methyltransferase [Thiotrichales bacterium]